jgi:hypothetical protein
MSSHRNARSLGRLAGELLRQLREALAPLVSLLLLLNLFEFVFEALDRFGIEELIEQ